MSEQSDDKVVSASDEGAGPSRQLRRMPGMSKSRGVIEAALLGPDADELLADPMADPTELNNVACRLVQFGRAEEAEVAFARAARVGQPNALASITWMMCERGEHAGAVAMWRECADRVDVFLLQCADRELAAIMAEQVPNFTSNVGLSFLALGDREQALALWAQAAAAGHLEARVYPAVLAWREGDRQGAQRLLVGLTAEELAEFESVMSGETEKAVGWFAQWSRDALAMLAWAQQEAVADGGPADDARAWLRSQHARHDVRLAIEAFGGSPGVAVAGAERLRQLVPVQEDRILLRTAMALACALIHRGDTAAARDGIALWLTDLVGSPIARSWYAAVMRALADFGIDRLPPSTFVVTNDDDDLPFLEALMASLYAADALSEGPQRELMSLTVQQWLSLLDSTPSSSPGSAVTEWVREVTGRMFAMPEESAVRERIAADPANAAEVSELLWGFLLPAGAAGEAEAVARRALRSSSAPDGWLHLGLGAALSQQNRHTEAEEAFTSALATARNPSEDGLNLFDSPVLSMLLDEKAIMAGEVAYRRAMRALAEGDHQRARQSLIATFACYVELRGLETHQQSDGQRARSLLADLADAANDVTDAWFLRAVGGIPLAAWRHIGFIDHTGWVNTEGGCVAINADPEPRCELCVDGHIGSLSTVPPFPREHGGPAVAAGRAGPGCGRATDAFTWIESGDGDGIYPVFTLRDAAGRSIGAMISFQGVLDECNLNSTEVGGVLSRFAPLRYGTLQVRAGMVDVGEPDGAIVRCDATNGEYSVVAWVNPDSTYGDKRPAAFAIFTGAMRHVIDTAVPLLDMKQRESLTAAMYSNPMSIVRCHIGSRHDEARRWNLELTHADQQLSWALVVAEHGPADLDAADLERLASASMVSVEAGLSRHGIHYPQLPWLQRLPSESRTEEHWELLSALDSHTAPADLIAIVAKGGLGRRLIAARKNLPAEAAAAIAHCEDPLARMALAENAHMAPDVLTLLAEDPDDRVRCRVARHDRTPAQALIALAGGGVTKVFVAQHANTPVSVLTDLSGAPEVEVRMAVAGNISTPAAVLAVLSGDRSAMVRQAVAGHASTPAGILRVLAEAVDLDERDEVQAAQVERWAATGSTLMASVVQSAIERGEGEGLLGFALANNPSTPPDALTRLASHGSPAVRSEVAGRTDLSPEVFARLAGDESQLVRASVHANHAAPQAARATAALIGVNDAGVAGVET